jgi:hypothetical protein
MTRRKTRQHEGRLTPPLTHHRAPSQGVTSRHKDQLSPHLLQADSPSPQSDPRDPHHLNRTILVCGVLVLTALALILYAITRDKVLLLASGIVGTSISTVLYYYFKP